MEISPILLQETSTGIESLLTWLVAGCTAYLAAGAVRVRIRRIRKPSLRLSGLTGLGFALALSGGARASDLTRRRLAVRPTVPSHSPPWSEPGGLTPPRLPGSTARDTEPVHPAIHPSRPSSRSALFPREGVDPAAARRPRDERADSLRRHPAGKGLSSGEYEVVAGDTLWEIAAHVLNTGDERRIARFWPRLHRLNRALIGRDPNKLFPGQVLQLPHENR